MEDKGKWILYGVIAVLVVAVGFFGYNYFFKNSGAEKVSNYEAVKDKENRSITIINKTGQVINDVFIYTENGSEIEIKENEKKNPDTSSFSFRIKKEYSEYKDFKVKLVDRYNTEYEKVIKNVKPKGNTEVVIEKDDAIEDKDSFWKGVNKFFNGD